MKRQKRTKRQPRSSQDGNKKEAKENKEKKEKKENDETPSGVAKQGVKDVLNVSLLFMDNSSLCHPKRTLESSHTPPLKR